MGNVDNYLPTVKLLHRKRLQSSYSRVLDEATQHEDSVLYKVPTCFDRYDPNRSVKFRENYAGCGRSNKNHLTITI